MEFTYSFKLNFKSMKFILYVTRYLDTYVYNNIDLQISFKIRVLVSYKF